MADSWRELWVAPVDTAVAEAEELNPSYFSAEEIRELQRRFGVHGAQPRLGQLFTKGLRSPGSPEGRIPWPGWKTCGRLCSRRAASVRLIHADGGDFFDEMQHAKPGKDTPILAESGLFKDHGLPSSALVN
jgi:hypothetical protein